MTASKRSSYDLLFNYADCLSLYCEVGQGLTLTTCCCVVNEVLRPVATFCEKKEYDGWFSVVAGFAYEITHFTEFNGSSLPLYVVAKNGFFISHLK